MKTIINKLRYTLLLGFIALAALGNSLDAATPSPVTVCNGTSTNNHIPLYGLYYDEYVQLSQMIYPYSLLANIVDKPINSLTFYASSSITDLKGGTFNIKIGTTSTSQFGSTPTRITGLTTVVTTNMTACQSGSNLVINFDQPFTYTQADYNSGKNLVIEFESTSTGQYQGVNFYGVTNYSNASYYTGNGTTTRYGFLPKLTFGFAPTDPVIMASPTQLAFSAQPNQTQAKTVNVSSLNLTGDITATLSDANGVYKINNSTNPVNLGNGGTLSITYSPTAVGSHNATVTLSSSGADPVTITLNGTCEQSSIVCDYTNTNANLPVYGSWFDSSTGQHNQILYPEGKISDDLNGKKITKITFYPSDGINFYKNTNGGTVTIKLGNMPRNTTGYASNNNSPKSPNDGFVTVKTIELDTEKHPEYREWVFENLDDDFIYNGGDLLIDVTTTQGGYGSTNFLGETQSSYTGYISYTSYSNTVNSGQQFLPKVKFDWEDSAPITQGTVSPSNVDFGAKNIGGTYTATVTVRNTGNQPFTPTIDATGLPQGITVAPTTIGQMGAGGTQNLTVTFEPTAEQSYSGTFTVTIPVPDDNDIVVTVTVTGSGFYANRLTSNTTAEIPVYKSEAKADGTYIFSKNDVDGDINRTLSYGNGNVNVEVLVKDEEPVTSYDLRHKVGSGNWASVATATQDSSDPKVYAYNNETFTIPNDATEMWIPMTDAGVDASSVIYYVPVTYANGIVTQGNTYGAPQVQATTDPVSFNVTVSGWKSAQGVGAHWTQTVGEQEIDYCIYMPLITVSEVSPAFTESRVPYKFRAWLTDCTDGVVLYNYQRVPNTNDPNHSHIEGDTPLTLPKYLGELSSDFELTGSGPYIIGDDPYDENAPRPDGDVQPLNTFAAPSVLPDGAKFTIVVRAYYYQVPETRGALMLRDGEGAPADGYGYGEGSGEGQGGSFMTAVNDVYTDREVVDVKYVNLQGMQSDKPFDGINIVVTRYSDGSTSTTKVVR